MMEEKTLLYDSDPKLSELVKLIFRIIDTYYDKASADKIASLISNYTEEMLKQRQ